jgi:hypothetical protein
MHPSVQRRRVVLSATGLVAIATALAGTAAASATSSSTSGSYYKLSYYNAVVTQPTQIEGVVTDSSGDVYAAYRSGYANEGNYVQKIAPDGTRTIVAGNGQSGAPVPGPATASPITPSGMATDSHGNLFISTNGYDVVKVDGSGNLSIVAGDNQLGAPVAGPATSSPLAPAGIAIDGSDNLYIDNFFPQPGQSTVGADVVKVDTSGTLSVFAGNGDIRSLPVPGQATASPLYPTWIAADPSGNVFVLTKAYSVGGNYTKFVEKVTPSGILSTIAGGAAPGTNQPGLATNTRIDGYQIAVDGSENLYIGGVGIAEITPDDRLSVIAGNGTYQTLPTAGPATLTSLLLYGLAVSPSGTLYGTVELPNGNPTGGPATMWRNGIVQVSFAATPPVVAAVPHEFVSAMKPTATQLSAYGGAGPLTWALLGAPQGLSVSSSGTLSANFQPTVACWNSPCTYAYGYRVRDQFGTSYSGDAAITVYPGPLYFRTAHALPSASRGAGYSTQVIKVGRGWGTDEFKLIGGSLPPGMWLSPLNRNSGKQYVLFGGRPTAAGKYGLELESIDQRGHAARSWFYISVQ